MSSESAKFRVGVFVLAAILMLGVLLIAFSTFPSALFKRHNHYTVVFPDAPGVGPGTPVRRSGVRIGEVQKIELDNDTGLVRVDLLVDRQFVVRKSDEATLMHGLLGGDTTIDFIARRPNGEKPDMTPLEPGAEISGSTQAGVQTLLNQTNDLMPTTRDTLIEMRRTLNRFDRLAPQMEEAIKEYQGLAKDTRATIPELRRTNDEILVTSRNWGRLGERLDVLLQTNQDKLIKSLDNLNDALVRINNVFSDENQRNLNTTLKNVKTGSENLESMTRNTDELVKESRKTIAKVNDSVRQADEVLINLQHATKPMAERSDRVMRNLDESTEKLNRMMDQSRDLLRLMTSGESTFRYLLTDPQLYNNLNDAACMLTRIMPRVDRALKDIEVFADKVARHPESLGLGGVVVPGSGLKR